MSYAFPKGVDDGFQVELENGVTYEFKSEFQRWDVVKGTGNSVWITDELPDEQYTSNGDLWFDNTEDTMQLFLWHEESDAWLPVAPPTTLEDRVAEGEEAQRIIIQQVQAGLEEQEKLQNKVNALEGVVGEHSLVFTMDNSNPRAGEFNLKNGAMQVVNTLASADYITLTDTDSAGNAINLERITEGDVLRFSAVDGQVAELKITDGTNGFFAFTKVSGELDRLSEMPYQFILLSSFDPTGLATIDYVDAQDSDLQTKINGKIGKSGNQILEAGEWRIRQPRSSGGTASFVVINDNVMHLYHVAYPENGEHAANMQYVDDQIAAIPAPSGGVDASADYDWTGHHSFNNNAGPVTFSGANSDASGSNDKSWLSFLQNSNGSNYVYFGLTNNYWDNRWTLGAAKMTWAKNQNDTAVVQIDQDGLQVKGSPVTRNMTVLTALKSSSNFDELKAKLIELLEAEQAEAEA